MFSKVLAVTRTNQHACNSFFLVFTKLGVIKEWDIWPEQFDTFCGKYGNNEALRELFGDE